MEQIQGYKLVKQIGEGGMATVFQGVQNSLNRPVAIKVLLKTLVERSSVFERFNRESMIIAQLSHPNIIHVIDRGVTPKGMPYFVMEYIEGSDLKQAIIAESLKFNHKLDLSIQVCKALSYAHKNGVIHRDIKPANILIDKEGNAKVLDFGIAQFYDETGADLNKTQPGTVMGTLAYMSPEQQNSADSVTALSDLYSLGIIMYELFTGVKPLGRFLMPSELNSDISKPLQDIIVSCLEADPSNRPSSADEIKDHLLKLLRGAHLKTHQKKRASLGISNVQDKFSLLDVIKENPQGSVYLFENKANNQLMIIKRQPSTKTGFIESKLLTSLRHKNIAGILGASKNEKVFIIVREYLSGGSLKDRLINPHPIDLFIDEATQICEGLSFAHKNRIIHGNLRPSNILFADSGEIKITDFGLDEHYTDSETNSNWFNIGNEPKSIRADVLAAGTIFYQILTGTLPKWKNNLFIPVYAFKQLPLQLQKVVAKMITPSHEKRHRNFDEVLDDIRRFSNTRINTVMKDTIDSTISLDFDKDTQTLPAENAKPKKRKQILTLFLLILLFLSVVAYLVSTNEINVYVNFIEDLTKTVSSYIRILQQKY